MNAKAISPEEQIRRVARVYLSMPRQAVSGEPPACRPNLRGLIEMLERHLNGDLPPISVAADRLAHESNGPLTSGNCRSATDRNRPGS